ncbi:MAG TPA: endonuclease/exonuclease/phosphatase family protein [Flavobacteriales bacterium]
MRRFLLSLLLSVPVLLHAQSVIRVMDYNLLNFPQPVPAGRADTLRKILAHHPVDLLIVEEIRSAAGAASVLTGALNVNGEDRFSAAPFVSPISAPWLDEPIAQTIYYDHDKFGLKGQTELVTNVRDINVYTLYLRTPSLASGDTTFLTVCALHLKAGDTDADANSRVAMIAVLMDHLEELPAGRSVIVAGDMNLYTGAGPEFTSLMQPAGNIQLADPLGLEDVDWSYSSSFASIYTQSTRTTAIYDDGSGGGVDDRFDIVLTSSDLLDNGSPLHVQPGSYKALGNSGTCYNQNITSCSSSQTPYAVLRALYYMSDHLPVVLSLVSDQQVGIPSTAHPIVPLVQLRDLGDGRFGVDAEAIRSVSVLDLLGRDIAHLDAQPGGTVEVDLPCPGTYVLSVRTANGTAARRVCWAGQ